MFSSRAKLLFALDFERVLGVEHGIWKKKNAEESQCQSMPLNEENALIKE